MAPAVRSVPLGDAGDLDGKGKLLQDRRFAIGTGTIDHVAYLKQRHEDTFLRQKL
jgi:hypothetical protein